MHGAYAEALEKHVLACRIPELAAQATSLKILDVCYGLGYNSGVALELASKVNPNCAVEIIALENDPEIIKLIASLEVPEHYREAHALLSNNASIQLLLGDARKTITGLESNYFDAIFFDPFSPAKCPELWQAQFVAEIVRTAKPGAYISTYSSSRIAKDSFQAAGCSIEEGPKLGRRNGGVLARKLC